MQSQTTSGSLRSTTVRTFCDGGIGSRFASYLRKQSQLTSTAVTRWSKPGTTWEGVSLDTLFADLETDARYTMVRSYGDYSTNLPLKDLLDDQAWIAFRFDGKDLAPEHGGPARRGTRDRRSPGTPRSNRRLVCLAS